MACNIESSIVGLERNKRQSPRPASVNFGYVPTVSRWINSSRGWLTVPEVSASTKFSGTYSSYIWHSYDCLMQSDLRSRSIIFRSGRPKFSTIFVRLLWFRVCFKDGSDDFQDGGWVIATKRFAFPEISSLTQPKELSFKRWHLLKSVHPCLWLSFIPTIVTQVKTIFKPLFLRQIISELFVCPKRSRLLINFL